MQRDADLLPEGGLALGLFLAATGVLFVPLARAAADRIAERLPEAHPDWGAVHVLGAFLVGVVASVGAALLPGADVLALLVKTHLVVGSVAATALALTPRGPGGLPALGIAAGGNVRSVAAGVLAYVLLVPPLLGVILSWPGLAERCGIEVAPQAVLTGMLELRGAALALAVLLAVALQPLLEEVVFRGFLQPILVRRLGGAAGVIVTSAVFALLHGTSALLPIFALSLLLGWIQLRTRRLAAAWAVHALHNGLVLTLVLDPAFG